MRAICSHANTKTSARAGCKTVRGSCERMRRHHLQHGVHDLLIHVHIRLRPALLARSHTVAQRTHLILPRDDVLDEVDPVQHE